MKNEDVTGNEIVGTGADGSVGDDGRTALADLTVDATPEVSTAPPVEKVAQTLPIIVNGRSLQVVDRDTTYEDLIDLAYPGLPVASGRSFTVTFRNALPAHPAGALIPKQTVRLAPGAVVNVAATTKG